MKYYQVLPPEDDDPDVGVAYAPEGVDALAHPKDPLDIAFTLKDGSFADFLMSDLGWRLFSDNASAIISSFATQEDSLQWHTTRVQLAGESRTYSGIWFTRPADVLDSELTRYVSGTNHVIEPCFNGNRIARHHVFTWEPELSAAPIIVSEALRDALLGSGCTGISFVSVKIAPE
jgi:hypothetical protein